MPFSDAVVIPERAQNRVVLYEDCVAAEVLLGCGAGSGQVKSSANLGFLEVSK